MLQKLNQGLQEKVDRLEHWNNEETEARKKLEQESLQTKEKIERITGENQRIKGKYKDFKAKAKIEHQQLQ